MIGALVIAFGVAISFTGFPGPIFGVVFVLIGVSYLLILWAERSADKRHEEMLRHISTVGHSDGVTPP